jgi:DNA-directed RNA polymerase specialized sigma24 family protein
MHEEDSVTQWIARLRAGDPGAAELLWGRYFPRLVGVAQRRLRGAARTVADEEDVALSAFHNFCQALQEGALPELGNRDHLWRLLLTLTERKAIDLARRHHAAKRGGKEARPAGDSAADELTHVPGREPSPAFAALVADECERLLDLLGDEQLRLLAVRKLEGYSNEEIARELSCGLRTVERKLGIIRTWWERELQP